MKILVTGGCGFIGSNFIRLYLKKNPDHKVTNLDKLTYCGNPENLKDLKSNPNYTFIEGDICDEATVQKAMKDIDMIFHFAAESHVDNSIQDPYIFTKTNVIGTHIMLECARKQGKIKRFIHISTDEVYGSVPEGASVESDPVEPNSPYSASKTGSDHLARSYYETYKLPVIITRSSNNFGPYQFPEKLIPLFITNLLQDKKIPLYGDGMNIRDWIYVEDNCEGILTVAEKGTVGEIYNIGGGNELPNLKITKDILSHMKKDDSFIQKVTDRLGHDRRYALNSAKLHALGWKPKHDFESALKATIDWYTQNESWWKPLKEQKVMILGAQGMLGKELSNVFPKTIQLDLQEVDITNQKAISECIAQNRPDVVINAAAYTDVDGAEANKEIAHKVNADAVLYIAEACKGINATLIHYSTDYIFNGQSEKGYAEDQSKDPINAYGETKAIGEDNIIKTTDNYYILRTSWLYGNQGKNFVETMLKLAKEKDSLKVINDQTGSPTYAKDLAEATKNILKEPFGIYHRTNDGSCTWYEFAKEIFTQTNTDITLEPCTTQEYPTPAKRPTCSILINNKLNPLPDWKDALSRYLKEKEQLEESP